MKVNVTATRCIVENDVELNAGEYNINKFYFTFSPEYLDNYVKKALFVAKDKPPIEMVIANDECDIPNDILKKPGTYMFGVYAYEVGDNEELILRYSPEPTHFYVNKGSYIENAESPTEPDPDEFAQYYQAMQELVANAKPEFKEYIDENLPTVEIGSTTTLQPGSSATVTNSGTDRHPVFNFGIPEGEKGDTIKQIEIESNDETYQFKIKIYDDSGKLISESNMVDLPIEIFVKNTDYATENVGGVIKSSREFGFVIDESTGKVTGVNTSYSDLSNKDNKYIISKGTLDKYVTGKRLVSRSDYADSTTAGVIRVGTNADVDSNGYLKGNVLTYNQYIERNSENFISKGTLENLLKSRNYLKTSDAETAYSKINETGSLIELAIDNSTYIMSITLKDKNSNTLSSDTIDLPLETMVVDAYYDKYSREIVLTLKSGTTTRFSVADLVSGLQSEITANNKLKSDLVDDTNSANKFVTLNEKTTWNNKSDFSGSYNDLTNKPDLTIYEEKTNKITTLSEESTDTQYPSGKCVYESQEEQNEEIDRLKMVYNALSSEEATGESITIDGTAEVPFRKIDLKGNTSQKTTTGKNLFGYGITAVDNTASYRPNQYQRLLLSATTNPNEVKLNYNGTYCFAYIEMNGIDGTLPYSISFNIKENTTNYTPSVVVDTTNSTNQKLVILINGNNKGTNTSSSNYFILTNIQVESGSTLTQYEPYTNGASPNPDYPQDIHNVSGDNTIKVEGKNLFDGVFRQGNQHNNWNTSRIFSNKNDWKVNVGDKFTFSTNLNFTTFDYSFYIMKYPYLSVSSNTILYISNYQTTNTFTINCEYEGYLGFTIRKRNESNLTPSDVSNYWFQIEKGSSASEFQPYQSASYPISLGDIELCKIGDYQDYFYKNNGKWYKHSEIGKVAFSDLVYNAIGGNFSQFSTNGNIALVYEKSDLKITGNRNDAFCNLLTAYSDSIFSGTKTGFNVYYNNTKILLSVPLANVEEFAGETLTINNYLSYTQNYIKGLEGYIYYILATPTNTEITNSTLINQLNNLEKAYSYDEQTNISQVNNDLPFIITAEAILSLQEQITDDLTDYVKNTDYASSSKGGVFKIGYGTSINNSGIMYAQVRNYNDYSSNVPNELFISKGTLENVITGKDLTTKAYVDGLVGDIGTILDNINGEVIGG